MKYFYLIIFFTSLFPAVIFAQDDSIRAQNDSLPKRNIPLDSIKRDTLQLRPKSVKPKETKVDSTILQTDSLIIKDSLRVQDSLKIQDSLQHKITDSLQKKISEQQSPARMLKEGDKRNLLGKEWLFYYLIFLLILFGLLRRAFAKYFYDLFRVFFKTTLKQRQTQEQLLQSPLPSVFMNSFFVLSTGLYVNFLLYHFGLTIEENFWVQYLYCAGALASIYIVKFIGLKITGWLFNVGGATDSYIFIVFIINKMVGIFLLPFLILLAFTQEPLYSVAMIISWFGLGILLIYRFILSYGAVRKEVKLNSFHFILYVLGFEVIPLLLIYKLLMVIF